MTAHILNIKEIPFDNSDKTADAKIQIKYTYQKNKMQKPRRNKSAFILFSNEARSQIKADKGNLNSNEMMVELAGRWKNLNKEDAERYKLMAKNDKIRYQQELVDFAKLHPDETIHNKTKNNHVKKPCSAYGMFLREKKDPIKEQHPNLKMADILKLVSQEWKKLTEDEKKVYKDKAGAEKEEVRIKLCEAIIRDQATKKNIVVPQAKGSKKVKRSPVAPASPEISEKATAVKTEDTIILTDSTSNINLDMWAKFDPSNLPTSVIYETPDIQIKTEIPGEPEKKSSILQLFPASSLELILNPSLFMKKHDTNSANESGLLGLFSRPVQKNNDVLNDILFDLNFDKNASLNLLETSLFKLKSESRNSISQYLNLSQARPPRTRNLNDVIKNLLGEQESKDNILEDSAISIEKKNS